MLERRVVALVAVVVVLGAAVAFFLLSSDPDDDGAAADPPGLAGAEVIEGNVAEYFAGGDDVLVYKSGSVLLERPVDGGREKRITDLEADDVFAAPGSPWLAYYETPSADTKRTVLRLMDVESGDTAEIRNAHGPVWSPDGSRLAYLKPTDPKSCRSLSACSSTLMVEVWDVEEGASVEVPGAEASAIAAWSGLALLVQEGPASEAGALTALSLDGTTEDLDVTMENFVSASPDGRWLVIREEGGVQFVPTGSGEPVLAQMPGFELTSGTWTHDSERVLGIASPVASADKRKKAPDALAQLVAFSVDEPFPEFFEESYGVFGDVMWGPGNDYVGFGRRTGDDVAEFVYCPVGDGDCASLMAYGEGTFPVRLQ